MDGSTARQDIVCSVVEIDKMRMKMKKDRKGTSMRIICKYTKFKFKMCLSWWLIGETVK